MTEREKVIQRIHELRERKVKDELDGLLTSHLHLCGKGQPGYCNYSPACEVDRKIYGGMDRADAIIQSRVALAKLVASCK